MTTVKNFKKRPKISVDSFGESITYQGFKNDLILGLFL